MREVVQGAPRTPNIISMTEIRCDYTSSEADRVSETKTSIEGAKGEDWKMVIEGNQVRCSFGLANSLRNWISLVLRVRRRAFTLGSAEVGDHECQDWVYFYDTSAREKMVIKRFQIDFI